MSQLSLPGLEPRERFERFKQFHRDNPQVFRLFRQFAEEALHARQKVGARAIWERMRWYACIETTSTDYRLNDHYTPYFARLLMLTDDRFAGFFETRDGRFDVDDQTILQEVAHHTL